MCAAFAASFLIRIARLFPRELDLKKTAKDVEELASVLEKGELGLSKQNRKEADWNHCDSTCWTLCSKSALDSAAGQKAEIHSATIHAGVSQQGTHADRLVGVAPIDCDATFHQLQFKRFFIDHAIHFNAEFRPSANGPPVSWHFSAWRTCRREDRISRIQP